MATYLDIPILGVYLRRNQIRGTKKVDLFRVRNLWTKLIKDIRIDPVSAGRLFTLRFELEDTNILKPDEERDLIHDEERGLIYDSDTNTEKYLFFPAAFDPKYATANFAMTISFKDAQNNKYKNIYNLGKDGVFLKESSRLS
jgi:hypothetical protein